MAKRQFEVTRIFKPNATPQRIDPRLGKAINAASKLPPELFDILVAVLVEAREEAA
jgi:hypothetical protein